MVRSTAETQGSFFLALSKVKYRDYIGIVEQKMETVVIIRMIQDSIHRWL